MNQHQQSNGDLTDVIWGDAGFVAVGIPGRIVKSSDGSNWTVQPQTLSELSELSLGTAFISRTVSSPSSVQPPQPNFGLVSTNGVDWSRIHMPEATREIAFGNGWFIATGSGVYRARIPGEWTEVRGVHPEGDLYFQNGAFVLFAAGERRDVPYPVRSAVSTNGLKWVQADIIRPLPVRRGACMLGWGCRI